MYKKYVTPRNTAGGETFLITPEQQLERFLILGTEGGTYYATESAITQENIKNVRNLLDHNPVYAIDLAAEISNSGRAMKNDQAILVLAMAFAHKDIKVRKLAAEKFNSIIRTGSHLLMFVDFVTALRGWGRLLKTTINKWYESQSVDDLAYQMLKYQNRNNWTQRDVLRSVHPKATDLRNALYQYITHGDIAMSKYIGNHPFEIDIVHGYQLAKVAPVTAIRDYGVTHEMLPTEAKQNPDVWRELAKTMPATALVRNLSNLTKHGVLVGDMVDLVCERLSNTDWLKRSRVHPMFLFNAWKTYGSGQGYRGSGTWEPVQAVLDVLEKGIYNTFQYAESSGKRTLLALDVSGSTGAQASGILASVREVEAVMALTYVRSEKAEVVAFSDRIVPFPIGESDTLASVENRMEYLPFGRTDCAQPMIYALNSGLEIDHFIVLTDNETWYGGTTPVNALRNYRKRMGINAKLSVVAMTATPFSIADPEDINMMDFVGADVNLPAALTAFAKMS